MIEIKIRIEQVPGAKVHAVISIPPLASLTQEGGCLMEVYAAGWVTGRLLSSEKSGGFFEIKAQDKEPL